MPKTLSNEFVALSFSDATLKVDKENDIITGVAVLTKGKTRDDRFDLDEQFLKDLVKFGNKPKKGQKSRFGHPEFFGSDSIGKAIGFFKNFRIDGDIVRADLHFYKAARKSPLFSKDVVEYLLELASEAPEAFGVSIVFRLSRITDEHGNTTGIKITALEAVDVVDEPAANHNGLFSKQNNPNLEEFKMETVTKEQHDEALAKKGEEATEEGKKSANDLFSALKKQFPDEHEFVSEQFSKGASVEDALSAFKDVEIDRLKEENKTLSEKSKTDADKLKAKTEEAKKLAKENSEDTGSDALETDTSDNSEVSFSGEDIRSACLAIQEEKKCSYITAVKLCKETRPELF